MNNYATLEMFGNDGAPIVTRKQSPMSSHLAENHINRTGKRQSVVQKVAKAVRKYPNCTAAELAHKPELVDCAVNVLNAVRSRLSELQDERYPISMRVIQSEKLRKCTIHGTQQTTWRAHD
jgi:hypothetical protein